MSRDQDSILPIFINADSTFERLESNESPFNKSLRLDFDGNPNSADGTGNPSGEGQNQFVLTPTRSNKQVPGVLLPSGYNINVGSFESVMTKEMYFFTFNGAGNHCIHVLNGNTGVISKVIQDPTLNFSDNPTQFIANHRVTMRVSKDANGNILEKHLLITDGKQWQKWINVIAAISTNGFDATQYPYWSLQPPHFDRRELLEWAVRPIMYNPKVTLLANTTSDAFKVNRLVDQGFQFAVAVNYTDGRISTLSPYSQPLIVKSEDYLNSPDNLSKNAQLTIYAGSPLVESIDIYVRQTTKVQQGVPSTKSWGDWYKYDRIQKFQDCNNNSPTIIGTQYWLRKNPWPLNNYDPINNTITYIFDNSKLSDIVSQDDANRLQTDLPQISVALTDIGDAALLCNNRYGYDNVTCDTTNNLDVVLKENTASVCTKPLRKIVLYSVAVNATDQFTYISQVGYYNGADTQMRFGGLSQGPGTLAVVNFDESKLFGMDFADKSAFMCYLKGTPYSAIGVWYQVNNDNTLVKIPNALDFSNTTTLSYVQNVFLTGGYFVCRFEFNVPSDRYIATLGRHNVATTADYRNTSTYIMGIANSRQKSAVGGVFSGQGIYMIKPNAIVSYSKEMEIDCTNGDVDTWGNNQDLFYVYCPHITHQGNNAYRFIEGYLKESPSNPVGMEMFPYYLNIGADDTGVMTDKNGFYFAYTKRQASSVGNIEVRCSLNCAYPFNFEIPTTGTGIGYKQNGNMYVSDRNNGVIGDCNRISYTGKITDLTGTIGYSNIGISVKDGGTVYTKSDGTFELIVHNGQGSPAVRNVYVNAGSNFIITGSNCGQLPLFLLDENLVSCINCKKRSYPNPLKLSVYIQGGTTYSLKENGAYAIGFAVADFAGRLSFVNKIKSMSVSSFFARNDMLSTYFQLLINGPLKLNSQFKWFAPYVTNQLGIIRYMQWVGDSISYIDNNGNTVTDSSSAVFCSIVINSLYNYNLAKNFSTLATYQFSPQDRLRVLDDGQGHLFNNTDFSQPIDIQIVGTNYNQAAINSGILPNTASSPVINNTINNTVNTTTGSTTSIATQNNNTSITLFVKYDPRLDRIIKNNGFWIEIYTPAPQSEQIPFNELTWRPVINGEVADFTGYSNGKPVYNFLSQINIDFWDTCLISRNITIPNVGNRFFNHPFESPNISDGFGAGVTSGGRKHSKNDNAKQIWFEADVIKSDKFITGSKINGLGTFRGNNRKDFSSYPWGAIIAAYTERSIIIFICENDFFTTNYDFHYSYANAQGVMVTNLDNGLSTPFQKIGSNYGVDAVDTSTVGAFDEFVWWFDRKNESFVLCDYKEAKDISDIRDEDGRQVGIKSYISKKTQWMDAYNLTHTTQQRFDAITGFDPARNNIYLTFRPRRNNSNDPNSYVNNRRNLEFRSQETFVFNIDSGRWTRMEAFTPEAYGSLKGDSTGVEMYSFAAGIPYLHNNTGTNASFMNFYGVTTEPVLSFVINKLPGTVKILQSLAFNATGNWFVDMIFDSQKRCYSYIPFNYFKKKEQQYYSEVLRNMVSYLDTQPGNQFRSTLLDGKRIFGTFFYVRMVGSADTPNDYKELKGVYFRFATSEPTIKLE